MLFVLILHTPTMGGRRQSFCKIGSCRVSRSRRFSSDLARFLIFKRVAFTSHAGPSPRELVEFFFVKISQFLSYPPPPLLPSPYICAHPHPGPHTHTHTTNT